MARIKIFIILALALTVGGMLAYATYNLMQAPAEKSGTAMQTRSVVVAGSDLQLGTELRVDDLRTVEWPAASTPTGVFAKPADLVGRGLVVPVVQNEPIIESKLAPKEGGTGLPPAIPSGMRAVSVRVNEVIGVAGYVLPGTHVDVLATAQPTEQRPDVTTKLVLPNVQVLTAGTRMEQPADKGKPIAVTVVTLLVTPEQAERLTLAATEGKVQLALRNPLDSSAPTTPGIRPAVLLGWTGAARGGSGHAAPKQRKAQAPAEAPAPTVEMIRGDKRAVEQVK